MEETKLNGGPPKAKVIDASDGAGADVRITILSLAILALIGILLLFTGFQAARSERNFFREVAQNANQEISTLVGRQFSQMFTNSTGLLEDIARFPAAVKGETAGVAELFQVLLKRHDLYRALYLLDGERRTVLQQLNVGASKYQPLDERKFGLLARKEVTSVLSEFYKIEEDPAITFACPVLGPRDEFLGVLGAELDLNFIQDIIGSVRVGRTGAILLVDRDGGVIFSSPGFKGLETFGEFDVKRAFERRKGHLEYGKTEQRLAAYQTLRALSLKPFDLDQLARPFFNPLTPGALPDWLVVVQQNADEAYMVADRMKYNLIILVVVGVIGLAVISKLWVDSL